MGRDNGVVPIEARRTEPCAPFVSYPNIYAISPGRAEELKQQWRQLAAQQTQRPRPAEAAVEGPELLASFSCNGKPVGGS